MHNYYVPKLSGMPDTTNKAGLGDLNAFATYLAIKNTKTTLGIGPLIVLPTATDPALGSGKWQAGLALIFFQVA